MKLFKVDIWIKDNNFKTYLVVADCESESITKAINECEEPMLIGATTKIIENIDGYKIYIK